MASGQTALGFLPQSGFHRPRREGERCTPHWIRIPLIRREQDWIGRGQMRREPTAGGNASVFGREQPIELERTNRRLPERRNREEQEGRPPDASWKSGRHGI